MKQKHTVTFAEPVAIELPAEVWPFVLRWPCMIDDRWSSLDPGDQPTPDPHRGDFSKL